MQHIIDQPLKARADDPARGRRLLRALAGCVALVVLMTGCGDVDYGPPKTLHWDLSRSHTMDDVDWTKRSRDSIEVRPIASLTIELSDGRQIHETEAVTRVDVVREGKQLAELGIYTEAANVDDAPTSARCAGASSTSSTPSRSRSGIRRAASGTVWSPPTSAPSAGTTTRKC